MFEHFSVIAVFLTLLVFKVESVTVPWGDFCGTDHMKTYKRKQVGYVVCCLGQSPHIISQRQIFFYFDKHLIIISNSNRLSLRIT